MANRIVPGTYTAVAKSFQLGYAPKKGTPQVVVDFEIVGGEFDGYTMPWFGYFTDKTEERTLQALRYAGWRGDDIAKLDGLGSTKVQIVVDDEEWEGKTRTKIQFVNKFGGGGGSVKLEKPMDDKALRLFAASMKAKAKKAPEVKVTDENAAPTPPTQAPDPAWMNQSRVPGEDDDIDF